MSFLNREAVLNMNKYAEIIKKRWNAKYNNELSHKREKLKGQ